MKKTLLLIVALSFSPRIAEACGGFFCSQTQSVNQAAERIIFAKNPDGTVTSIVQIQYQGPSEKFSWVLPVPSIPTVSVSSNAAFSRLQAATNPQYLLTTTTDGDCRVNALSKVQFDSPSAAPSAGESSVQVVAKGSVGPYDYEVLQVNASHNDKAEVAIAWLQANGYDVTSIGPALIRPYLEQGDLLLAFRLSKQAGATSGDIRPVVLRFKDDLPMIPIKLTAVAAQDNMGVMVWVLGEHRSVPTNYRHLVLNEAAIDWTTGASNYNTVVNLAADEAGGQGFVTEYADASAKMANIVFSKTDSDAWNQIKNQQAIDTLTVAKFVAQRFGALDGLADALEPFVKPQGNVTLANYLQCPGCYSLTVLTENSAELIASIEANVIKPMRDTQSVIDSLPYITRMYSTLSADEMTVDPDFAYNPDLPTYSNIHTATRVIHCNAFVTSSEAPWTVTLSDGTKINGTGGGAWPLKVGTDTPATSLIVQMSTSGLGEIVKDNITSIDDSVKTANTRGGCACGSNNDAFSLLAFLGLVFVGRLCRRRL